ncbi:MAG: PatB family C-S lyase [Anaerolineales bacterium]|nr:PatB family C-S lyase [Anaerolineales bacterium]
MKFDFNTVYDRLSSDSSKWSGYDRDVLALCIADMDFKSPDAVVQAIHNRAEHGIFGYVRDPAELRGVVVDYLEHRFNWRVSEQAITFSPGVVSSFNLAIRASTSPGDGVLIQTPVYNPILAAHRNHNCSLNSAQLERRADGSYGVDCVAFEDAITEHTRIFIQCSPHNPVGRVFTPGELTRIAECCARHDLVICSDEIHCDLVFDGRKHVPIASISPEIADRVITLMSPAKSFNLAGLNSSFAIITNPELRRRFEMSRADMVSPRINLLGQAATIAAYRHGWPWLEAALDYLSANRELVYDYVNEQLPGLTTNRPEGTYLAWIDCRDSGIHGNPYQFFLDKGRVALVDGKNFGPGGEGFVRLNFGCPRETLLDALGRMRKALLAMTD